MKKVLDYRNITLIPVQSVTYLTFDSALECSAFLNSHEDFECEKYDRYTVILYRFMVVDTSHSGFCLTQTRALTYKECVTLIDMYL